jgi:hypothetical protein
MMKTITLLIVVQLAPLWGADEAPKLPPAIQAIVEKAKAEVSKNRKVYDAANSKSLDTAEKALKGELEKMTKAGKLEEAMTAKKMLESVRADVVAKVDEQAKAGSDMLGEEPGTAITPNGIEFVIAAWVGKQARNNIVPVPPKACDIKLDKCAISIWVSGSGGGNSGGNVIVVNPQGKEEVIGEWTGNDNIPLGSGGENDAMPNTAMELKFPFRNAYVIKSGSHIKFQYTGGVNPIIIYKGLIGKLDG